MSEGYGLRVYSPARGYYYFTPTISENRVPLVLNAGSSYVSGLSAHNNIVERYVDSWLEHVYGGWRIGIPNGKRYYY